MKRYLAISALILSLCNGCTQKQYIDTPRPKLQTWIVAPLDVNISYEVYES